jgi:hypothetical protein
MPQKGNITSQKGVGMTPQEIKALKRRIKQLECLQLRRCL